MSSGYWFHILGYLHLWSRLVRVLVPEPLFDEAPGSRARPELFVRKRNLGPPLIICIMCVSLGAAAAWLAGQCYYKRWQGHSERRGAAVAEDRGTARGQDHVRQEPHGAVGKLPGNAGELPSNAKDAVEPFSLFRFFLSGGETVKCRDTASSDQTILTYYSIIVYHSCRIVRRAVIPIVLRVLLSSIPHLSAHKDFPAACCHSAKLTRPALRRCAQDCYAVLMCESHSGQQTHQTDVRRDGVGSPVWNDETNFNDVASSDIITVRLFDHRKFRMGGDVCLGQVRV